MERFYTSKEQSKRLVEMGIDTGTADMCYEFQKAHWPDEPAYFDWPQCYRKHDERDIPCWSIGALFSMMPSYIEYNGEFCFIKIAKTRKGFWVECSNNRGYIAFGKDYKTLIDGLFQLLCWLMKNEYI